MLQTLTAVCATAAAADGGFFGGAHVEAPKLAAPEQGAELGFGFGDASVQRERRGIFGVSADGRTVVHRAVCRRATAVASRQGLGMVDGAAFEVVVGQLGAVPPKAPWPSARLVGLAPKGVGSEDCDAFLHGVHYSSDGFLFTNGHMRHSVCDEDGEPARFGKGDTIRCQLVRGLARFCTSATVRSAPI